MTTREDVIRIVEKARECREDPDLRGLDLVGVDLRGLDLQDANLRHANLASANLRNANLYYADLAYTNLRYANLEGANLRRADLSWADLWGINLTDADMGNAHMRHPNNCSLQIDYLPSGLVTFYPTPAGWLLQVGCWDGTLNDLRELIAKDDGWPGTQGLEVYNRRPLLEAAIALCEAHAAYHSNVVRELREKWGA